MVVASDGEIRGPGRHSPTFDKIRKYFAQGLCEVVSTKAMVPIGL